MYPLLGPRNLGMGVISVGQNVARVGVANVQDGLKTVTRASAESGEAIVSMLKKTVSMGNDMLLTGLTKPPKSFWSARNKRYLLAYSKFKRVDQPTVFDSPMQEALSLLRGLATNLSVGNTKRDNERLEAVQRVIELLQVPPDELHTVYNKGQVQQLDLIQNNPMMAEWLGVQQPVEPKKNLLRRAASAAIVVGSPSPPRPRPSSQRISRPRFRPPRPLTILQRTPSPKRKCRR